MVPHHHVHCGVNIHAAHSLHSRGNIPKADARQASARVEKRTKASLDMSNNERFGAL